MSRHWNFNTYCITVHGNLRKFVFEQIHPVKQTHPTSRYYLIWGKGRQFLDCQ